MMKQLTKWMMFAFVLVGLNQNVFAQAKVAHVDFREVMTKMPQMIEANKQLEQLSKTYDTEFGNMVAEYRSKLEKYENEATTKTDKENEDRARELQDMEKRIQDYRQNAQKELSQKENDLMQPLMEKAKKAVEKVGKAKGFQYVMDGSMLLLMDGPDLTADVKKELGF
jgi:outer membrane protein